MPYYRRNIYVLSIAICLAAISWNQVMPFLALFLKQMGVRPSLLPYWVGIVFAVQSLASMLAQPFWGKLGDSVGRKPMIIRAGLCLTGIYYAMSFCTAPWQLAVCRFLNGALTGFIPGSYALIATNTPAELAPKFVATAQSAVNAGLIVGPALGGFLASLVGYRGSMQIAGTAVLVSTFLVWRFVEEPNKTPPAEKTSLAQDFATSLRSPVQLSVMFAVFLGWVYGSSISPYLALHLARLAGDGQDWLVGVVFSLPALAFLLTARSWTALGESWGFSRTILAGMVGGAIGGIALAFPREIWSFAALYFITGLWLAAMSPSAAAITCTMVEHSFRGRAYGMQQAAGTLGGLIAPLAAARIWAAFGMRGIFVFVGVVLLVGALVFRQLVRRWPKGSRGG